MYLEHFQLKEYPFSLTPDTDFYFDYAAHHDVLNVLAVALRSGEGFIKVTGEVGLGKTLLCRRLLNGIGHRFVTAYIPDPQLTPVGLRVALAQELGIKLPSRCTGAEVLRLVQARTLDIARTGKRVVLILDEAHQLSEQTLEAVRLLTNLETEKFKLLQVVLFGQPELDRRLKKRSLRQLQQRVVFSAVLKPLNRRATEAYINHRLKVAGCPTERLFTGSAIREIYKASRGIPRLVNVLSHKALMAAFGPAAARVTGPHARRAILDTESAHRSRFGPYANLRDHVASIASAAGLLAFSLLPRWVR